MPGPALAGEGGEGGEAPAGAGSPALPSRTPSSCTLRQRLPKVTQASSCGCAAVPQGTPRVSFLHEGAQQFANTDRRSAPQHSSKVFAVVAARVLCQQTLLQHSKASNGMHAGRKHSELCSLSAESRHTPCAAQGPAQGSMFQRLSPPLSLASVLGSRAHTRARDCCTRRRGLYKTGVTKRRG